MVDLFSDHRSAYEIDAPVPEAHVSEDDDSPVPEEEDSQQSKGDKEHISDDTAIHDPRKHDLPKPYVLDMSSAEKFIADLESTYNVELLDRRNYLSGSDGDMMMRELDNAFSLFSPRFIRALVMEYEKYDSAFIIVINGPSATEYGMTEWDGDLTITLNYDRNYKESGVTAAVLAHELAHAVHFIIEEYIGVMQSKLDMLSLCGEYRYVQDDYDDLWDPDVHGFVFAYSYGMYDYYEDIATIIELLVDKPEDMFERFIDDQHEPLYRKALYIRDLMYYYISDACFAIFTPLYDSEVYDDLTAA